MKERRKYTREFKERAVAMADSSEKPCIEIEQDLGISRGSIYAWRKQLQAEGGGIRAFPGNGNPRDEELTRLRKENAELREEREILRKAMAIFSRASR